MAHVFFFFSSFSCLELSYSSRVSSVKRVLLAPQKIAREERGGLVSTRRGEIIGRSVGGLLWTHKVGLHDTMHTKNILPAICTTCQLLLHVDSTLHTFFLCGNNAI